MGNEPGSTGIRVSPVVLAVAFLLIAVICIGGTALFFVTKEAAPVQVACLSDAHSVVRSQHFIYGLPRVTDGRYDIKQADGGSLPGISVLGREGFWVGHADRFKVPVWVCTKWSKEYMKGSAALNKSGAAPERYFRPDPELPEYARGESDYGDQSKEIDRGHMEPYLNSLAFGEDNCRMANLMSNVVPQKKSLNRGPWLALEEACHKVVGDRKKKIDTLWITAGSVFEHPDQIHTIGNGIGVPEATYKIVAWLAPQNQLQVRAYLMNQDARGSELEHYLVSVDTIEQATGLDFFSELDDPTENRMEAEVASSIW